jgi:hypothetical protein
MVCLSSEAESFSFAVLSTAKEKKYFLCDLCVSSEAGGLYPLTYPHSIAWTISIAEGLRD